MSNRSVGELRWAHAIVTSTIDGTVVVPRDQDVTRLDRVVGEFGFTVVATDGALVLARVVRRGRFSSGEWLLFAASLSSRLPQAKWTVLRRTTDIVVIGKSTVDFQSLSESQFMVEVALAEVVASSVSFDGPLLHCPALPATIELPELRGHVAAEVLEVFRCVDREAAIHYAQVAANDGDPAAVCGALAVIPVEAVDARRAYEFGLGRASEVWLVVPDHVHEVAELALGVTTGLSDFTPCPTFSWDSP